MIKKYGRILNGNNHSSSEQKYDVKIVTNEEEIIELAKQGYDCQQIGEKNSWWKRSYRNISIAGLIIP